MSIDYADILHGWLGMLAPDFPEYEREYRFHATRKWRFDFAWPVCKVAVEVDGGRWQAGGGRHGSDSDREKINAAVELGWRVLRYSPQQVDDDPTGVIEQIKRVLDLYT